MLNILYRYYTILDDTYLLIYLLTYLDIYEFICVIYVFLQYFDTVGWVF